jgi:hypothetical protein
MESPPASKRQKTSDAPDCTSCDSLDAAASAQHLPCLRKFLSSSGNLSEGRAGAALDRVAAHDRAPSALPRDCTGCIKALLQVETSPPATLKSYKLAVTPLSLSAAAGCENCVLAVLEHHLQHGKALSYCQWRDAVLRAVGCAHLGVLQKLFTALAISDKARESGLGSVALKFALEHHQRHFVAQGSEQLHSGCLGMLRVLQWLDAKGFAWPHIDVYDKQATLFDFIKFNCVEGVRHLGAAWGADRLDALLHEACSQQCGGEMVLELVHLGADIYSEKKWPRANASTVLHAAATSGNPVR